MYAVNDKVLLQAKVDRFLYEELRAIAKQHERSLSSQVRFALRRHVESQNVAEQLVRGS